MRSGNPGLAGPESGDGQPQFMTDFGESQTLMMQVGMQYGAHLAERGERTLFAWIPLSELRHHFRVDTKYVQRKLLKILVPIGSFKRQGSVVDTYGGGGGDQRLQFPPIDDINAPDLYIPVMGFITLVIVSAYVRALAADATFAPEYLGTAASSLFFWLVLEVIIIKVAKALLALPAQVWTLDWVSLCGYKYVGMCIACAARASLDPHFAWIGTVALSASAAVFALRTVREMMSDYSHEADGKMLTRAHPFTYAVAGLQVPLFFYFSTA